MTVLACVLTIAGLTSLSPPQPVFDQIAFQALPAPRKLDLVLAALDWREQQLQNMSYSLIETVIDQGKVIQVSQFDVKRVGSEYQLHCRHIKMSGGVPATEFWIYFDGQQSTSLTIKRGALLGVIRSGEEPFLREVLYNNLLGYRTERSTMTLPDFIRSTMKWEPPAPIDITTIADGEAAMINVCIMIGPTLRESFVLDPRRDYMIVRHRIGPLGRKSERAPTATTEVLKASNEGGFWVPLEARKSSIVPATGLTFGSEYKVTSFSRGSVKKDELAVEFPAGTRVVDTVKKER